MTDSFSFEYEMGESREGLARGFARLLGSEAGAGVARGDARVEVTRAGGKAVAIEVEDLPPRRMGGLLTLPVSRVRVTLAGHAPAEAEAFKADFHRAFQRAGG